MCLRYTRLWLHRAPLADVRLLRAFVCVPLSISLEPVGLRLLPSRVIYVCLVCWKNSYRVFFDTALSRRRRLDRERERNFKGTRPLMGKLDATKSMHGELLQRYQDGLRDGAALSRRGSMGSSSDSPAAFTFGSI